MLGVHSFCEIYSPYPLMPEDVQEEDEEPLEGVEDGEDPCKCNGTTVHYKKTEHPGEP